MASINGWLVEIVSSIGNMWKSTILWRKIVSNCWSTLGEILTSPKFFFFSVVSIFIGTCGIWAPPVFKIDLSASYHQSVGGVFDLGIQNFAVFMYNLGMLGILAAEYFIKGKDINGLEEESMKAFCLLVWVISFALSFWALKQPLILTWHLIAAFWLTTSLWMSLNIKNKEFKISKDHLISVYKDSDDFTPSGAGLINGDDESQMPGQGL